MGRAFLIENIGVEDSGKIGFKDSRIQGFERSPSTTTGNINRF
jgi:hypothetical protein